MWGNYAMKALRAFSALNTVVMFMAVLWGAWVTTTDSGDGCGAHWPLCKGTFMPDWDYPAIVEFGHRLISGLAGLLTLILLVWIIRSLPGEGRLRRLAWGTLFFVSFQGTLGAAAVIWPQPDLVLALHFGFSLLCFTFALLVTVALSQLLRDLEPFADSGVPGGAMGTAGIRAGLPEEAGAGSAVISRRARRLLHDSDASIRTMVWSVAIYTYLVIYLGAYVRHIEASMACTGWPLCNGQLWPTLYGPVGANFAHRLGAALGVALVVRLWLAVRQVEDRPDLRRGANWALVLILAQVVSGALFPLGYFNLITQVLHTGLIALFWGQLSYLCYQTLPAERSVVTVGA